MFHKSGIIIAAAITCAALAGSTAPALSAGQQKSCHDICMARGGLTTGPQRQKCIQNCEARREGRR